MEYEKATLALAESDEDSAEHYIMERSRLATEIDQLTEEIGRLCDREGSGELLMQIALAAVNYESVPQEYRGVYEKAQETRSVIFRIKGEEEQALAHLVEMKNEAELKIRENQHIPKIKKYLTDLSEQPGRGVLKDGKA